jgi:hypothetical protein
MADKYSGTTSASAEWHAKQKPYSPLKKVLAALLLGVPLLILLGNASQAPPTASSDTKRSVPPAAENEALAMLRSQGYDACDQVRGSLVWRSEPGFTLYCTRWKFEFYENGGRWKIVPKSEVTR